METGQYIQDGDVQWIITDIRDGNQVGHIRLEYELLDGYIKANGATVKASDYPRLTAWVKARDRVGYALDESNDMLTVPDLRGRFIEGGEEVNYIEQGLPNITGSGCYADNNGDWKGALYSITNGNFIGDGSAVGNLIGFDASRSNPIYGASETVQPPALTLIPQIKY